MGVLRHASGWTNEAAWLNEANADLIVGSAEVYEPGPREVLVKNEAIAFSPEDSGKQRSPPPKAAYPAILGTSFGARVIKVGQDAGEFVSGDRVACCRPSGKFGDHRYGAFQKFVLASIDEIVILDSRTEFQDAVSTLADASLTVAALSLGLGIERPPAYGKGAPKNKRLLVYGGSSSIGGFAVEYASFSGYSVVTTSSAEQIDYVSTLGARVLIDHTLSENEIVAKLKANGPYDYVFDSIGSPSAAAILNACFSQKGGKYVTVGPLNAGPSPGPANVERVVGDWRSKLIDPANRTIARWFYEDYVSQGLGSGAITPTQQINVEGDLEKVQQVLEDMGPNGTEGHKFILTLPVES